jgi:putative protease
MKNLELLAPAGNLEKLKTAVLYGADAVYMGGQRFGLRAQSKNFSIEEMREGVVFAHEHQAKVYVTLNIYAHQEDFEGLEDYLQDLARIEVDAVIVSDPGILMMVRQSIPEMEVHLSTQANTTNAYAAKFWHQQGVKRIVTAREVTLEEMKSINKQLPEDMEVESFVHGAMCMAYSGRCLLSNFMTGRDANRGNCAQACRWSYHLVEEQRPNEYFPVEEDERGTYILNSKDLCLLPYLKEYIEAGVTSLKIEGRMKSQYYVATIVRAYRLAIDAYLSDPIGYKCKDEWMDELRKVSHRDFTTGFLFGKAGEEMQLYQDNHYIRTHDFIGIVLERLDDHTVLVEQRNKFSQGDLLEYFGPGKHAGQFVVTKIWNESGEEIKSAPHPKQKIRLETSEPLKSGDFLRKPKEMTE